MKFIRIDKKEFWKSIPDAPGVYLIYSLGKKGFPKKIQRILKLDENGVLYIGKSKNLRRRLIMLWRSLNREYKTEAHVFAEKYNSNKRFRERFPFDSLAISYTKNNDPSNLEKKKIKKYIIDLGEMPPFNSKL